MKLIAPALIGKNQKELTQRFNKVKGAGKYFHLDVMDGKFVRNKSLQFDFKLPKGKYYYAHLMNINSMPWLRENIEKLTGVSLHVESNDLERSMKFVESKKKLLGLAINPRTPVSKIKYLLPKIKFMLIMTVNPGRYGAKFLPNALRKIKEIKKINPKIHITVDGSINDKTIKSASRAGANAFAVGSYLQNSEDPRKSLKTLKGLIK